jgi:bifunctional UDP-N-acetylglucosamine pyrophosphorylase/glucosamine-1-phosphate N-acetyltransferase
MNEKKPTKNSTNLVTEAFTAIVLAAGKGTRMMSPLPKVLHPVAGLPMIHWVLDTCLKASCEEIRLVLGHQAHLVQQVTQNFNPKCFLQEKQQGTADAVKAASFLTLEGLVLIVSGDHPLIEAEDLKQLVQIFHKSQLDLMVVSAELKKPKSFGRIVRHKGDFVAIVEAKDASVETLKICEVNTGIYLAKADVLKDVLPKIKNENAQKEFYLTDIVSLAREEGYTVEAIRAPHKRMAFGVNSQEELAEATRIRFRKKANELLNSGVVLIDPATTYIESTVTVGSGSVIYPNVFLRGQTELGSFCVVESGSFISDCKLGNGVQIKAHSYLEKSTLGEQVHVRPFARVRPETEIGDEAHIGNFVELKKVKFGKKSKAGHLTYLGDAEIGEEVNIGCGTITCNYAADKQKYRTKIGDRVFVGSDTQFVAPIEVGADAVIGSGSTITKNVPSKALAVARGKQIIKENYSEKFKKS